MVEDGQWRIKLLRPRLRNSALAHASNMRANQWRALPYLITSPIGSSLRVICPLLMARVGVGGEEKCWIQTKLPPALDAIPAKSQRPVTPDLRAQFGRIWNADSLTYRRAPAET